MTAAEQSSRSGRRPVRSSTWITLLGLAALSAVLVWSSMSGSKVECEVCMTYDGRPSCATAAAPDEETAVRTATDTACATIALGRAASLECGRLQPDRTSCH